MNGLSYDTYHTSTRTSLVSTWVYNTRYEVRVLVVLLLSYVTATGCGVLASRVLLLLSAAVCRLDMTPSSRPTITAPVSRRHGEPLFPFLLIIVILNPPPKNVLLRVVPGTSCMYAMRTTLSRSKSTKKNTKHKTQNEIPGTGIRQSSFNHPTESPTFCFARQPATTRKAQSCDYTRTRTQSLFRRHLMHAV